MSLRSSKRLPYLYVAGPLFSVAERSYNSFLKHQLSQFFEIYLPQEDGALMPDLISSGMSSSRASKIVFENDINAIKRADLLLILLDGRSVDEGAALELGVAYALGKQCIGLQTDFRRLAPFGNNPMLDGAMEQVFLSFDDLEEWCRKKPWKPFGKSYRSHSKMAF